MPKFQVDREVYSYNDDGTPHIAHDTTEVEARTFALNENGIVFYGDDGGPCGYFRGVQSVRLIAEEPEAE